MYPEVPVIKDIDLEECNKGGTLEIFSVLSLSKRQARLVVDLAVMEDQRFKIIFNNKSTIYSFVSIYKKKKPYITNSWTMLLHKSRLEGGTIKASVCRIAPSNCRAQMVERCGGLATIRSNGRHHSGSD